MRQLLVLIAIILAVVIIKRLITTHSRSTKQSTKAKQPDTLEYQDTVRCAHCGTHVPLSSAIKRDDGYYCSEKHYLEEKNLEDKN
ncbi:MAG: PP0621 family protein [Gammaproteobacteria bacterium]|jgi:uncharacterized protein